MGVIGVVGLGVGDMAADAAAVSVGGLAVCDVGLQQQLLHLHLHPHPYPPLLHPL